MFKGLEVTTEDVSVCREKRASIQKKFIIKYLRSVISFTLNIPGPVKNCAEIKKIFDRGKKEIIQKLSNLKISVLDSLELCEDTGNELILCVDAPAELLKTHMEQLETQREIGRLYDIDVINGRFEKLSRKHPRKCLLCDNSAAVCARSRRHSVEEMIAKIERMIGAM
jgi:holo-ACP synthase